MDILKQLEWRYACKKFNHERLLNADQIESIKKAFNLTATSYGLQPLKLVVVQNKTLQSKLVAHSYNQQQIGQASAVLVICIEQHIDETYIRNYFELVKSIRNTPDDILESFRSYLISDFAKKSEDTIRLWAIKQAYIALGNLLNVLAVLEIDSCPMEGFIPAEYDKVLGLTERGIASVLALPIGYRAEDDLFSSMKKVRKPLEDSCIAID